MMTELARAVGLALLFIPGFFVGIMMTVRESAGDDEGVRRLREGWITRASMAIREMK
jgi:hypothetical protein